jgi:hypothetical protein
MLMETKKDGETLDFKATAHLSSLDPENYWGNRKQDNSNTMPLKD